MSWILVAIVVVAILMVALDRRSRKSEPARTALPYQRDEFLKGVCEAAGVPLVQVPAKSGYVIDDVKRMIAPHLTTKGNPNQKPSPHRQASKINGKVCQNCSETMVKRVAQKGSHAGMEFWSCSAFPKCKTVEVITN